MNFNFTLPSPRCLASPAFRTSSQQMTEEYLHADGNEQDAAEQFRFQSLADNISEFDSEQMTGNAKNK